LDEISGWFFLMNQKPIIFYQICLAIRDFQEYSIMDAASSPARLKAFSVIFWFAPEPPQFLISVFAPIPFQLPCRLLNDR
jgi:hypothetical protein